MANSNDSTSADHFVGGHAVGVRKSSTPDVPMLANVVEASPAVAVIESDLHIRRGGRFASAMLLSLQPRIRWSDDSSLVPFSFISPPQNQHGDISGRSTNFGGTAPYLSGASKEV
ncbi:hypothetical protein J1N35_008262 [Gossypium stocksii]|uniref:Uncharacterized protein n=1 Tax=Gossypium stocksii TaxID=47602 RepID=A0A9D4AFY6_9ROSI|nr:hypothetical protein J1N35_008262 [Gossypium stocksii]